MKPHAECMHVMLVKPKYDTRCELVCNSPFRPGKKDDDVVEDDEGEKKFFMLEGAKEKMRERGRDEHHTGCIRACNLIRLKDQLRE